MPEAVTKPATYDDLLAVDDRLVAEIINGRLITNPRPAPKHAHASSLLGGKLSGPYNEGSDGPGGWWVLDEPELHLGADVLVPDIGGWRRARMPGLPETAWFELPPDWVCEVLSPGTARVDRAEKMPIYAGHRVQHAWLIDPEIRTLEVYENHDGHWLLLETLKQDDAVSAPPFDAISFDLSVLWAD